VLQIKTLALEGSWILSNILAGPHWLAE